MRPAVRAPLGAAMHGVLVKGFLLFRRELRVEILDGLVAGGHASLMLGLHGAGRAAAWRWRIGSTRLLVREKSSGALSARPCAWRGARPCGHGTGQPCRRGWRFSGGPRHQPGRRLRRKRAFAPAPKRLQRPSKRPSKKVCGDETWRFPLKSSNRGEGRRCPAWRASVGCACFGQCA